MLVSLSEALCETINPCVHKKVSFARWVRNRVGSVTVCLYSLHIFSIGLSMTILLPFVELQKLMFLPRFFNCLLPL